MERAQQLDPTFPITTAVRGMLQRNTLGADMLKRLRVYAGAEHGHHAQQPKALSFDQKGNIKLG
jgi:large subunit ribosomal protein L13